MSQLAALGGKPVLSNARHGKWPQVTDDDKRAVMDVLDRGVLSGSEAPAAKAFQADFAKYVGAKHALLCHSGTSALQVAVGAHGIGEGDEVIVPSYSFVATALCVISQGAIPVFVDVQPDTGNMDPSQVEAAISPRTRAIMPVHVHGNPADLGPLLAIAKKHSLILIEDAAQAHGATYTLDGRTKPVGTFGSGAGFSLQSSKNLSAGEGGIYVTDDASLYERANQIRNFAQNIVAADASHYDLNRALDGHRGLQSLAVGSMFRGNEMMAAFGRSQLSRLPGLTEKAQANATKLTASLASLPGVSGPKIAADRTSVFHKYRVWLDGEKAGVDLPPEKLRDATIEALRAEGCEVVLWQGEPLPSFPLFREMKGFGKGFPFSASDTARLKANYEAEYPATKKLLASSLVLFSQTCPLIGQDAATVELYAKAFEKVWEHRKDLAQLAR